MYGPVTKHPLVGGILCVKQGCKVLIMPKQRVGKQKTQDKDSYSGSLGTV